MNLNELFGGEQDLTAVDATKVQVGGSTVFENGVYGFIVEKAESKPTNAGDGVIASVMFREVSDDGSQRVLWQNYNLQNKSQKAQAIGREQWLKLCKGCGFEKSPAEAELLQDKVCKLALLKKETRDSIKARRANPTVEPEYENTVTSYQADPEEVGKTQQPQMTPTTKVNTNINL